VIKSGERDLIKGSGINTFERKDIGDKKWQKMDKD
tara:strand:- start:567 stop:671 length:105 start_codon:yes stop_codon:yes gene_type:complete